MRRMQVSKTPDSRVSNSFDPFVRSLGNQMGRGMVLPNMSILFEHTRFGTNWRITSEQLPGWFCSGPSRATALNQTHGSLRGYLQRANLPEETRRELCEFLGGRGVVAQPLLRSVFPSIREMSQLSLGM